MSVVVRLRVLGAVLMLTACESTPGGPGSTVSVVSLTTSPPSTTAAEIEMTLTGCSAPPVTFGLLCDVVGLVEQHHVDPPDRMSMATAALDGIRSYPDNGSGADRPRGFVCAVPGVEFEEFCGAVRDRLEVSPAPIEELVESAVESLLAMTVDPYTRYVPPELSGTLGEDGIISGVGMVVAALNAAGSPCVRIEEACPLIITTVIPESSASVGGLRAGDVIQTIDGETLNGLSLVKVASLIGGEPNTEVVVGYRRNGVDAITTLIRSDAGFTPISGEVIGNTGYIRLPEFGLETHLVLHAWLQTILDAGVNRLILDLRDNPGGFLFSVSIIGSEFLSSGLLYRTQSPSQDLDYPAIDGGIATRIPLIILVNGQSASAAEVLAAGLQERGRATVVGSPTYGKNLVQIPFELHNQGQLLVTTATWTTPGGASVAGTGVVPDLDLELDPDLPVADVVGLALAGVD